MMEGLKSCPHCGSESAPEVSNCIEAEACERFESCDENPYKTVVCNVHEGGCGATGGFYPTEAEAIAAWNARAERTCRETAYLTCSECGEGIEFGPNGTNNYCANCGAKIERAES